MSFILKYGTMESRRDWFSDGEYKKLPNKVGEIDTLPPESVHEEMKEMLKEYNSRESVKIEDIIDFHVRFERIHPFGTETAG